MKYKYMNIFAQIFILITTISFINSSIIKRNLASCKAGSYLANKKCQLCKAGTYSLKGMNKCYQCKAGTYSSEGSSECKICTIGTYSSKGASSCKKCKAGTSSLIGASKCSACLPGTYSKAGSSCKTCKAGTYSLKGSSKCTTCPEGTYSSKGASSCKKCKAGTTSLKGSSKCSACPAGTYSKAGSTCKTCPAGTISLKGSSKWTTCPAGTYSIAGSSCKTCPAGTTSLKGSSKCTTCPIGTYSIAGASCKTCPAGTYSLKGASQCTTCPEGTYSIDGSSCKACPAGTYSLKGASQCTTCQAGTYSVAGAKACIYCLKNYFSSKGASTCTKCPEGTYTDKEGSSECIKNINTQKHQDAEALRQALNKLNCDEEAIIKIAIHRTFAQRLEIAETYKSTYGRDLISDFQIRLFGNFEDAVVALFTDPIEYDADELYEAMDGFGTDEDTLIEIIASRPASTLEKIKKKYYEKYKRNLEDDIEDETSGRLKKLLIALLQCNRRTNTTPNEAECADIANKLYKAGEDKWGTDESVFQKYFTILSPQELAVVNKEYTKKTGHSLFKAIDEEFSGDANKMLKTILYTNLSPSEYFAIRVYDAIKGLGTRDNLLIRVLVSRSEIDMPKIKQYYRLLYRNNMYEDVKDDTSGDYQTLLLGIIG